MGLVLQGPVRRWNLLHNWRMGLLPLGYLWTLTHLRRDVGRVGVALFGDDELLQMKLLEIHCCPQLRLSMVRYHLLVHLDKNLVLL